MKKKQLYVAGQGGGCTRDNKTNLISVAFDYPHILDMKVGRELIVEGIDEILKIINLDQENKNYFIEFPVKMDVIQISIFGQQSDINKTNFIDIVSNYKNEIFYKLDSPEAIGTPLFTASEETFPEAQYILDHPDEVHRREVTSVQRDAYGQITELSGPWGMVIKRFAIQQIESGQFEYFVIEDGIKKPFKIVDGALCCS